MFWFQGPNYHETVEKNVVDLVVMSKMTASLQFSV